MLLGLAFCAALLLGPAAGEAPLDTCGECDSSTCPDVTACTGGVITDACGCCEVCARGLGQLCDPEETGHQTYGKCGEYLKCLPRTDIKDIKETTCQCQEGGQVCGSDGVTYDTLCNLLALNADYPDLHVVVRGPCKAAPVFKSRPEDKTRPLGSILVLDCEVSGHPVPIISWELNRIDGSSMTLPSDDPSFAVQVRGGPENNMVTGWVQIMRITHDNLGIYTCVAKNSEGEERASATVSLEKRDDKKHRAT